MRAQNTLARDAEVRGVGFLMGSDVRLRFRPSPANTGVVFARTDLPGSPEIPAHVRHVVPRERRTALQRGEAVVEMVEHVLAALSGLCIDNCRVEIDSAETPGCDGSSLQFTDALRSAGVAQQGERRPVLTIRKPVAIREGKATLTAYPGPDERLVLTYNLDYGQTSPIVRQSHFLELSPDAFAHDIAPSRTFLLAREAEALRQAGIGRRTSTADLLIFGEDGPIGNELRYPNECARHKLLDMVGDFALLGKDISGHIVAHRSGHQLNAELVRELLRLEQEDADDQPDTAASPGPVLDIGGIMELLPHRYPFLLVDRVLELEAGKRLAAIKNVSCNEPFFMGHWPGRPIMPGVLILEALAQAAGILIAQQFAPSEHVAMIASIDDVKLRRRVTPGDQLTLEIGAYRARSRLVEASGVARVGEQVAAEAKLRFAIVKTQDRAA